MILINGATGHLGSHLVKEALQQGYKVRATDLHGTPLEKLKQLGAEVLPADLTKPSEVKNLMNGVDQIIHVVGLIDMGASYELLEKIHVTVTKNLCEAAREKEINRMVSVSTLSLHGRPYSNAIDESYPVYPKSDYEKTKYLAEQMILNEYKDLNPTVIRPHAMYGPGGTMLGAMVSLLPFILLEFFSKVPGIKGGFQSNWVHVEDVARACLFVLDKKESIGRIYGISGESATDMGQYLQITARALGLPIGQRQWKIPSLIWKVIGYFPKPAFLLRGINNFLRKRWKKIQNQYGIQSPISSEVNKALIAYFKGSFLFSNRSIQSLGFQHKHPDFEASWTDTIHWYQKAGWLPVIKE